MRSIDATMPPTDVPSYLQPYRDALDRVGDRFEALLWASPKTQATRFEAICRLQPTRNRTVLDVGCGRADLLDYLHLRDQAPADYIGLEAISEFASGARAKGHDNCTILQHDFLQEPARMFVGAEIVVFSGSLNTLSPQEFYRTLHRAYDASAEVLIFNFLCSSDLAASRYLTWHDSRTVLEFCRSLSASVQLQDDYLRGDCTIRVEKNQT